MTRTAELDRQTPSAPRATSSSSLPNPMALFLLGHADPTAGSQRRRYRSFSRRLHAIQRRDACTQR